MKPCKHRLMREIQTFAFASHEAALYLDGHPDDKRAIAYFNMQNNKLNNAVATYEQNFGPLTVGAVSEDDSWTWIKGPWPWEYDANASVD